MKKLGLRQRFTSLINAMNDARRKRNLEDLGCLAKERINVIEFDGKIYFAYDQIPLVPLDEMKADAKSVLDESRKAYIEWKQTAGRTYR